MVLPQLIQNLSGDYWQIINFMLYFAFFGIIIRAGLSKTGLKDEAKRLSVILGLIFAIGFSSFEFARGGIIKIPGITLPTVTGYRGVIFSAGGLIPFLMLILFMVLTHGLAQLFIGKEKGYSSKEKDWLEKAGYYILAGFIVFILLGNISPDLSGMGRARIAYLFNTTLRPVIDLVFFFGFIWLLFKLMEHVKRNAAMGPEGRRFTGEEKRAEKEAKRQEGIEKGNRKKENKALDKIKGALDGLEDTLNLKILMKIKKALSEMYYMRSDEARERASELISELSAKIKKDRPKSAEVAESLAKQIETIKTVTEEEEKTLETVNRIVKELLDKVPEKARVFKKYVYTEENLHTKEKEIAKYLKKVNNGKKIYFDELIENKEWIDENLPNCITKIDDLREKLSTIVPEDRNSINEAVFAVDEAIKIETDILNRINKINLILKGFKKWADTFGKYFDILLYGEEEIRRELEGVTRNVILKRECAELGKKAKENIDVLGSKIKNACDDITVARGNIVAKTMGRKWEKMDDSEKRDFFVNVFGAAGFKEWLKKAYGIFVGFNDKLKKGGSSVNTIKNEEIRTLSIDINNKLIAWIKIGKLAARFKELQKKFPELKIEEGKVVGEPGETDPTICPDERSLIRVIEKLMKENDIKSIKL